MAKFIEGTIKEIEECARQGHFLTSCGNDGNGAVVALIADWKALRAFIDKIDMDGLTQEAHDVLVRLKLKPE